MAARLCEYPESHWLTRFKWVHCTAYESHLGQAVKINEAIGSKPRGLVWLDPLPQAGLPAHLRSGSLSQWDWRDWLPLLATGCP